MDDFHFDFLMSKIDLIPRRHTSRHALRSWHETKSFLFDTVKSLARSNRPLTATPKADSIEMTSSSIPSPTAILIRSFFKFGRPRLTHSKGFSEAPIAIAESIEVSLEKEVSSEKIHDSEGGRVRYAKCPVLAHEITTVDIEGPIKAVTAVFCIVSMLETNYVLFTTMTRIMLAGWHREYMLRTWEKDMRTSEIDWGRITVMSI
jgi:hypothetical protein